MCRVAIWVAAVLAFAGCGDKRNDHSSAAPAEPPATSVPADAAPPVRRLPERTAINAGLSRPSAVAMDHVADAILIANLGAGDGAQPYVMRVPAGSPGAAGQRLIEGSPLEAPRALAIFGDTLYVADGALVRRFHRETGAAAAPIAIAGAARIDAVAAGSRRLYAADAGGQAIYAIDPDSAEATLLAGGDRLGQPIAMVAAADTLWVLSRAPAAIYSLGRDGAELQRAAVSVDDAVGLVSLGGDGFIVFGAGSAILGRVGGSWRRIFDAADGIEVSGQVAVDGKRGHLVLPARDRDAVAIVPLP